MPRVDKRYKNSPHENQVGADYNNPKWPPRGNYVIPARTDYGRLNARVGRRELLQRIKVAVDRARQSLDNGRTDMAEETLRSIWRMADAIEREMVGRAE